MKSTDRIGRSINSPHARKISELVEQMEAYYDAPSGHAQAQPEKEEPAR